MIKVLVADKLSQRVVEFLEEIPEFEIMVKPDLSPVELKNEIKDYGAVVVGNETMLGREVLAAARELKIIVKAGIGLDNVDTAYTASMNIEVQSTPTAASITVAEYTLALMLDVCRFLGPAYRGMKEHRWDRGSFERGMELQAKTAGIIGFGRSGKEVAKRELAFGMKVLFYDVVKIETDIEARQVALDELLRVADFVSIHLPLTDSTRGLISATELQKMKKGVVLVNVSHRSIVDESALLNALQEERLRAAALDVFEGDCQDNLPLIDHDRVFPFPHLGPSTVESQERAGLGVIAILKGFFNV